MELPSELDGNAIPFELAVACHLKLCQVSRCFTGFFPRCLKRFLVCRCHGNTVQK